MSPETKKKLLYGGGALASIAALVLFLRNKQQSQMPISGAGTGLSGAGGPSSGSGQNNSAALNAAVALAVEQSRQQSALEVARLQANTALSIAGLQAGTAQQAQSEATKRSIFGPGGAATAAAPAAAKGVFDTIKELIDKAFGTGTAPGDETASDKANAAMVPGSDTYNAAVQAAKSFIGPQEIYGPVPTESSGYVGAQTYDEFKDVTGGSSSTASDYFQGSIGGGDSGWFGDNYSGDGGGGYSGGGSNEPTFTDVPTEPYLA